MASWSLIIAILLDSTPNFDGKEEAVALWCIGEHLQSSLYYLIRSNLH